MIKTPKTASSFIVNAAKQRLFSGRNIQVQTTLNIACMFAQMVSSFNMSLTDQSQFAYYFTVSLLTL